MKAEHRKELETNALADRIGYFVEGLRQGPSRTTAIYGSIAVAAVLLFVVYRLVAANAAATDSSRWLRWDGIDNREELTKFLGETGDTEQGRLARFELARLDLVDGLAALDSVTKAEAIKKIRSAADAYEKLAGESGSTPQLVREALLNAAKARESLGELDQAKQLYGKLAREYPQTLVGKYAAEQAKALETPGPETEELKQIAKDTTGEPLSPPPGPR
jgi:hypothetical protein